MLPNRHALATDWTRFSIPHRAFRTREEISGAAAAGERPKSFCAPSRLTVLCIAVDAGLDHFFR